MSLLPAWSHFSPSVVNSDSWLPSSVGRPRRGPRSHTHARVLAPTLTWTRSRPGRSATLLQLWPGKRYHSFPGTTRSHGASHSGRLAAPLHVPCQVWSLPWSSDGRLLPGPQPRRGPRSLPEVGSPNSTLLLAPALPFLRHPCTTPCVYSALIRGLGTVRPSDGHSVGAAPDPRDVLEDISTCYRVADSCRAHTQSQS